MFKDPLRPRDNSVTPLTVREVIGQAWRHQQGRGKGEKSVSGHHVASVVERWWANLWKTHYWSEYGWPEHVRNMIQYVDKSDNNDLLVVVIV